MRGIKALGIFLALTALLAGCGNSRDKKSAIRKRGKEITTGQQFVVSTGLNKTNINEQLSGTGEFICTVHDERQLAKVKEAAKSDPTATIKVYNRFLNKGQTAINIYGIMEGQGARIELFSDINDKGERADYYLSIIKIAANGDNLTQVHKRALISEELVLESNKYRVTASCKYSPVPKDPGVPQPVVKVGTPAS